MTWPANDHDLARLTECHRAYYKGVLHWYQSRLPLGVPLPNSLAEIESSGLKLILLTWLCGLRAHVANWVVLASFIPRLLLWELSSPFLLG